LTHDLFCDYFASEAVHHGQQELPASVGEALEEATEFLAERGDMPLPRARRVVTNPVAAVRCAALQPRNAQVDDDEVDELFSALRTHLSVDRQQALSGTCVRSAALEDGTYLFVVANGASTPLDVESAAADALRVSRVPPGSSSLAGAVALWLAELRAALAETERGELLAIPTVREELPAVLERAFAERKAHLDAVCAHACPTLLSRVLRELNFRGFHAVVLPSQTQRVPIGGGGDFTYHLVAFSFNADDVSVRVEDTVDDTFIEEPSTRMAAEDWLHEAPLQAALKDVRTVLATLLPGFAR
jgi:hypothetical protein